MIASAERHELKEMVSAEASALLWERGTLAHKLWPQQEPIYNTVRSLPRDVQTVVFLCARQFGKSCLVAILALEDCLANANVIVMIIGPTIKQTRSIVRPRVKLMTKDMPEGLMRYVKSEDTWYFSNGSELKLGGFDVNAAAQRGKTIHKIYLEETGDSNGDDYSSFIRSDLGPALTHSAHAQIIHATTLPKVPDHPFVLDTIPEAEMAGAFFKFTIDDNKKLSKEKYDQCVKLCGGRHTIDFKREYLCEQVRDSSIILAPEFDESVHVVDTEIPPYSFFWVSGDTGIIRDLTVLHLWTYDFKRAKLLVLDERAFTPDIGTATLVDKCLEMEAGHPVTRHIDTDTRLRMDLSHQHKFVTSLPRKDELEPTVNQVRVALQTRAVEISPKCKLLITTLRSGTFNKTRTDLARNSVLGHMDAFMSFAYGLRHANTSNPYPAYNGANPYTHYMRPEASQAAAGLQGLFRGPR